MTDRHQPSNPIRMSVGTQIRTQREKRGLSLAELSRRSGVHRVYIAEIEQAGANPTIGVLEALSTTLGCGLLIELDSGELT